MKLRWVSSPTESSRVPKRTVPPRLGLRLRASAIAGRPTTAAPANAVVAVRKLRRVCSGPFLIASSVMDVASQICWFWAEVGYVDERLLDQRLLNGAANSGSRGNARQPAVSRLGTACRHSM